MLLKLTEKCSMGCTHCMNSATPEGKHMTMDTLNDVLEFLIRNQAYEHLIVSGGEPTEHPDFEMIMNRILTRFAEAKQPSVITITTNGFWCLEHPEAAKRIAAGTAYAKVFWQVSTDSRYYPKDLPLHKRLWREPGFVLCDKCVTQVYPQGRALENNIPWKAKASKCFNVRAVTKQMKHPSIGLIVEHLLVSHFYCTPAIRIDGSISLGESDHCPKMASIYDSEDEIIQKIIEFKCHQCDFINDGLDPIYKQFL